MNHGSPVLFMVVGVHGGKSNLLLPCCFAFVCPKALIPMSELVLGFQPQDLDPLAVKAGLTS